MRITNFLSTSAVHEASVHKYLLPEEQASIAIRKHPALLLRVVGEIVLATALAAALTQFVPDGPVMWIVWVAWVLIFGRLLWKYIDWQTGYFIVTPRRVLVVTGLLHLRVLMMPLAKVVDITVDRPFLGRIFGYGTIVLESPGQQQALQTITYMPEPEDLYVEISSMIFPVVDGSPD